MGRTAEAGVSPREEPGVALVQDLMPPSPGPAKSSDVARTYPGGDRPGPSPPADRRYPRRPGAVTGAGKERARPQPHRRPPPAPWWRSCWAGSVRAAPRGSPRCTPSGSTGSWTGRRPGTAGPPPCGSAGAPDHAVTPGGDPGHAVALRRWRGAGEAAVRPRSWGRFRPSRRRRARRTCTRTSRSGPHRPAAERPFRSARTGHASPGPRRPPLRPDVPGVPARTLPAAPGR